MTDSELLKNAAKAAGIKHMGWVPAGLTFAHCGPWNPLTDSGQALELAVKLRIHVRHFPHDVEAQVERGYWREDDGSDPYAATRRAIVRAAAELGKNL